MLYHFSEEKDITIFAPRLTQSRPDFPHVVWAIDEDHEFSFYFPRACPRIVLYKHDSISDEHYTQFFQHSTSNIIVTVEQDWYSKIHAQTVYRYNFDDSSFKLFDETAGYYISSQTIKPEKVDHYDHLIERLIDKNIELRITPNLHPLRHAILSSGYPYFGIHKFANAKS